VGQRITGSALLGLVVPVARPVDSALDVCPTSWLLSPRAKPPALADGSKWLEAWAPPGSGSLRSRLRRTAGVGLARVARLRANVA